MQAWAEGRVSAAVLLVPVQPDAGPGCRAYYRRRRAIGDGHHQALRALGNRLVGYLHGGLRSRRLYDEATAWESRSDGDTELAA